MRRIHVTVLVLYSFFIQIVVCDKTTCMTDYESSEGLHYICFCDPPKKDIYHSAKQIAFDQGFSLADFAFNLAGNFFSKSIFVTFQSCRHLRINLDQDELFRIGSKFFRPDIQVRGISVEQVYHLELVRDPPKEIEEYLTTVTVRGLDISLYAVALVSLDAGAKFTSLSTRTKYSRLYINMKKESNLEEESMNVIGFNTTNIFFVTNQQKIRLKEGEELATKMKQLSLEMMTQTQELSSALTIFATIVLVGLFGFCVTMIHRHRKQKRLRDKSVDITVTTSSSPIPSKYTQVNEPTMTSSSGREKHVGLETDRGHINELISAILYRTRKREFRTNFNEKDTSIDKVPETSFYYKESSLSDGSAYQEKVVRADVEYGDATDCESHTSKISQQVFIPSDALQDPKPALKDRFMTFFSSVSKSNQQTSPELTKTKL